MHLFEELVGSLCAVSWSALSSLLGEAKRALTCTCLAGLQAGRFTFGPHRQYIKGRHWS